MLSRLGSAMIAAPHGSRQCRVMTDRPSEPLQAPVPGPAGDEPLTKGQRHTTAAAGILLAMFVISGSLALYSAYLLWRGEDAGPILAALPSSCEVVWMVDRPQEAAASLRTLGARSGAAGQVGLWAETLDRAAKTPGLDPEEAWGFCRRGSQWYAALPLGPQLQPSAAAQAARQTWEALRGIPWLGHPAVRWVETAGQWVGRDAGGEALAAVLVTDRVATISWREAELTKPWAWTNGAADGASAARSPLDAVASLNALRAEVAKTPLREDKGAREALERVGGGQMRLMVRGGTLTQLLASALESRGQAPWKDGLPWVQWAALALRVEEGRVRVHAQIGGGQRWAVWLKERFDSPGQLDAATVIPREYKWAGVLRVQRQSWPLLAGLDPVAGSLVQLFGDGDRWQPLLAGQTAWFGDGPCLTAVALLRPDAAIAAELPAVQTISGCPQAERKRIGDKVVVGSAQGIAQVEQVLADPSLASVASDQDQQRIQRDTQGVWVPGSHAVAGLPAGPLQLEWIWLDTGLVLAIDLNQPKKP